MDNALNLVKDIEPKCLSNDMFLVEWTKKKKKNKKQRKSSGSEEELLQTAFVVKKLCKQFVPTLLQLHPN